MKILRITESQYKRLVRRGRKLLSEQVVYVDEKDQKDLHAEMGVILDSISYNVYSVFKKPLYVKKIEDGVVYIDKTKYTQNEIDYIRADFENHVNSPLSTVDRLLSNPSDLGYDSGYDADYDWGDEDITVVEPDDDTTEDIEDNDEVAEVEVDNDDTTEDIDDNDDVAVVDNVDLDYDPNKTYSRVEYINLIKDIAINQMKKHNIPASITIAQAVLESGNGNSGLSREGLAHFGIKCGSAWAGKTYYADATEENEDGTMRVERGTCWRAYDSIEDSFEDHSKLLKNSRYSSLFDLDITDYKGWANGLKDAGYATDSQYPNKLINIIEKNNLQQYDNYENIIDCQNCITTELNNKHEEHINDENVKDFRWWINQDSNRLKSVTDKLKECCETKDDPTISTGYNKKNNHTIIAFSVVGNEWINTNPKPKKTDGEESIETVGGDCNLTEEEQQLFDSTIFNFKTANNFRWWIHQDKDRLEKVEKKLKSCGLSPELGIVCKWTVGIESPIGSTFFENQYMNRFGNYLKIPFKLYGSDWVNSGSVRPKSTYKNSNGNLSDNDLVAIQDDVSSNPEYLHKDAVDSWNKMVLSAKTDGIDLTISDAYRPCGEPGDYERYLNKEVRFTQWAAWREWNYRSKKAAEPKPNTEEKWIKKGGGKCKSHHGFKGAVDISNGKSWMRKNAPKFGWCKYTGEDWHWDYYGDDIDNKLSSDKVNCK